jgi:UbiD family decarboxylase
MDVATIPFEDIAPSRTPSSTSAAAKGERLPIAFTVGSHPLDFLAALVTNPPMDELHVIGAMRGAPLPIVKCRTIDVYVPADAEYVLEGYLDERGMVEPEGPYGEYVGYYGILKKNPVFHLTAITHRRDALFQTVTIGGSTIARTDTAVLAAVKTVAALWAWKPSPPPCLRRAMRLKK